MKMKTFYSTLIIFFIGTNCITAQSFPGNATEISPLLIHESIPDVTLATNEGDSISLLAIAKEKPTVLIFYRGGWCPYCNLHLSDLQNIEEQVLELGYQIVAISPDSPIKLGNTVAKQDLRYKLLSDSKMKAAKEFGIAYLAPDHYLKTIDSYSDGVNKTLLPVPAVFVLNQKGEIQFEYIDPNFKNRIKGELLLAVLQVLKKN